MQQKWRTKVDGENKLVVIRSMGLEEVDVVDVVEMRFEEAAM